MADITARLIYLGLLLLALAGWFSISNRPSIGKSLQMALVWGMIFLGGMAIYGLWQDITSSHETQNMNEDGVILVPRSRDGHFYLTLQVNNVEIEFLVDTGASDLVLSPKDAINAGIDIENLAFLNSAKTANGTVPIAYVQLEQVQLGKYLDNFVSAAVNSSDMSKSLLGMSYLDRYQRIEILAESLKIYR